MHPDGQAPADRQFESLEARLRALPQPPVPAGLEARLLASIPVGAPRRRRHWAVWVGGFAAAAAACLVAALLWTWGKHEQAMTLPRATEPSPQAAVRPPESYAGIGMWRRYGRVLDGGEPPPFSWPIEEPKPLRVSTSIPSDLFD